MFEAGVFFDRGPERGVANVVRETALQRVLVSKRVPARGVWASNPVLLKCPDRSIRSPYTRFHFPSVHDGLFITGERDRKLNKRERSALVDGDREAREQAVDWGNRRSIEGTGSPLGEWTAAQETGRGSSPSGKTQEDAYCFRYRLQSKITGEL